MHAAADSFAVGASGRRWSEPGGQEVSEREDWGVYGREVRELVDVLAAARHEVHEQIVAKGLRRGEVGLAAGDGGDLLHELDERKIAGQHERVNHDAGALAAGDFVESLLDHDGVEAEGVLVNAAVVKGERGRLAVRDYHDLLHVLTARFEDALGDAQAFAGVGVMWADLDARKLREMNVLRRIVKEHEVNGVAGVLRADEMGERHGNAFSRGEAVFSVQDHGV